MEHIVEQTNVYAWAREGHSRDWTNLTVPEHKAFVGTKILMGITGFIVIGLPIVI